MAGQQPRAGILGAHDVVRGDVVVAIVVERVNDRGDDAASANDDGRDQPHVPDQPEGAHRARAGREDRRLRRCSSACGSGLKPPTRPDVAALLHVPPGVAVMDDRREREVVDRRRRRGRPLQRAAVPRIAGRVAQRLAPQEAHDQLDEERQDAERDQAARRTRRSGTRSAATDRRSG